LAKTLALKYAPWLEINANIPMNRHADPTRLKSLFIFLATSETSYINTVNLLLLQGGETAEYFNSMKE